MKTEVIRIEEESTEEQQKAIEQAGAIIRQGGLVAFPTETVYGLGGDALNPASSAKIYKAKGRPSDNPLIVHIAKIEDLYKITKHVSLEAKCLADQFWPGPLTMIFLKNDLVPMETTGGLETVAVRMPSHKTALRFIEAAGGFVAAPSANLSGKPSPTIAKYVREDMDGKIEMILDGGNVGIGLESTIVDMTGETPIILRPGYITREMLEEVLGQVDLDTTILSKDSNQAPKAPGMKYRHYAPKGELKIVRGNEAEVAKKINQLTAEAQAAGKKVGVIATDETQSIYRANSIKSVGSRLDETSIGRRLYLILREFDDEEVAVIYSEAFSDKGMGQAIMNRLLKAAGHQVIEV
ncbi:MAG: threonylcarbamoyl-AMP synthase [Clostridiales bacterium]|nr:threonylcarbamoyl-AMP synthase [Clostridiales bacterium]